jgi:hypothetical protein
MHFPACMEPQVFTRVRVHKCVITNLYVIGCNITYRDPGNPLTIGILNPDPDPYDFGKLSKEILVKARYLYKF